LVAPCRETFDEKTSSHRPTRSELCNGNAKPVNGKASDIRENTSSGWVIALIGTRAGKLHSSPQFPSLLEEYFTQDLILRQILIAAWFR